MHLLTPLLSAARWSGAAVLFARSLCCIRQAAPYSDYCMVCVQTPDSLAPVLQGTMVASIMLAMQQKRQILEVCAAASPC